MFRYKIKVKLEEVGKFKHELRMIFLDKNSDHQYQSLSLFSQESVPLEYIVVAIEEQINEMLSRIATDKPNLHAEEDLHKDCHKYYFK